MFSQHLISFLLMRHERPRVLLILCGCYIT